MNEIFSRGGWASLKITFLSGAVHIWEGAGFSVDMAGKNNEQQTLNNREVGIKYLVAVECKQPKKSIHKMERRKLFFVEYQTTGKFWL